jgi:SET domain
MFSEGSDSPLRVPSRSASLSEKRVSQQETDLSFREGENGFYRKARDMAQKAISLDPENVEAYVALSRSLFHLRCFKEAVDVLEPFKSYPVADKIYKRSCIVLDEHTTGGFDLVQMMQESYTWMRLIHGDFVHWDLRLGYRKDGVRGLFANADFDEGTLLIAEKAIVAVFPSDPHLDLDDIPFQAVRDGIDDPLVPRLLEATLDAICHRHIGEQALHLDDGDTHGAYPREAAPDKVEPVLHWKSTYDISDRIYSMPTFGDCRHVENVVRYNVCRIDGLPSPVGLRSWVTEQDVLMEPSAIFSGDSYEPSLGLFYTTSFINHSCMANCARFSIGDFNFIYTKRKISMGDEITRGYWSGVEKLEIRDRNAKSFKFTCDCSLCVYQHSDPAKFKIAALYTEKFWDAMPDGAIKMATDMIRSLKKVFAIEFNSDSANLEQLMMSPAERCRSVICGPPVEKIVSYLSIACEMYLARVAGWREAQKYELKQLAINKNYLPQEFTSLAAADMAELALLFREVGPYVADLYVPVMALSVLALRLRSFTIPPEDPLTRAWLSEVKRLFAIHYVGDERIWDHVVARIAEEMFPGICG